MALKIKPSTIRYSTGLVSNMFPNGEKLGETLDEICNGRMNVSTLRWIRVAKLQGEWVTKDKERLWLFRQLERLGQCGEIPVVELNSKLVNWHANNSDFITMIGSPGGSCFTWSSCKPTDGIPHYRCQFPEEESEHPVPNSHDEHRDMISTCHYWNGDDRFSCSCDQEYISHEEYDYNYVLYFFNDNDTYVGDANTYQYEDDCFFPTHSDDHHGCDYQNGSYDVGDDDDDVIGDDDESNWYDYEVEELGRPRRRIRNYTSDVAYFSRHTSFRRKGRKRRTYGDRSDGSVRRNVQEETEECVIDGNIEDNDDQDTVDDANNDENENDEADDDDDNDIVDDDDDIVDDDGDAHGFDAAAAAEEDDVDKFDDSDVVDNDYECFRCKCKWDEVCQRHKDLWSRGNYEFSDSEENLDMPDTDEEDDVFEIHLGRMLELNEAEHFDVYGYHDNYDTYSDYDDSNDDDYYHSD